jgi:hypothetical protein
MNEHSRGQIRPEATASDNRISQTNSDKKAKALPFTKTSEAQRISTFHDEPA